MPCGEPNLQKMKWNEFSPNQRYSFIQGLQQGIPFTTTQIEVALDEVNPNIICCDCPFIDYLDFRNFINALKPIQIQC